jgi:hypothetical protein
MGNPARIQEPSPRNQREELKISRFWSNLRLHFVFIIKTVHSPKELSMTPVDSLSTLLKVNPNVGKFVFAGLGVLAAAVLLLSFGSDVNDAAVAAIYLLAFAAAATILSFISRRERMRAAICWIVIVTFGLWVIGLIESAVQLTGKLPRTPCFITLPIELPEACEARLTRDVMVVGGSANAALDLGPERIWLAQDTGTPVAPVDPAILSTSRVFIQFTDAVTRDQTVALAQTLTEVGWTIEGKDLGGELVEAGPDDNEVRFFHPEDQAAAVALAETLFALSPTAPVRVRDFSRLGSYTPLGQLEVWLQEIGPAPTING